MAALQQTANTNNKQPTKMAKQLNQNSLGTSFLISGAPGSAEEYDQMAGEAGACIAAANDDHIKHVWLTKFRKAFIPKLAEATGVEREVVSKRKTKSGEVDVYQSDSSYIEKVEAAGHEMSSFNDLAQQVADSIPFDLSGSTSGGRIGKKYIEQAEEFMKRVTDHGGSYDKFVDYITGRLPSFQFVLDDEGNPERDSIAAAIKADEELTARQAAAERAAAFAS